MEILNYKNTKLDAETRLQLFFIEYEKRMKELENRCETCITQTQLTDAQKSWDALLRNLNEHIAQELWKVQEKIKELQEKPKRFNWLNRNK